IVRIFVHVRCELLDQLLFLIARKTSSHALGLALSVRPIRQVGLPADGIGAERQQRDRERNCNKPPLARGRRGIAVRTDRRQQNEPRNARGDGGSRYPKDHRRDLARRRTPFKRVSRALEGQPSPPTCAVSGSASLLPRRRASSP